MKANVIINSTESRDSQQRKTWFSENTNKTDKAPA